MGAVSAKKASQNGEVRNLVRRGGQQYGDLRRPSPRFRSCTGAQEMRAHRQVARSFGTGRLLRCSRLLPILPGLPLDGETGEG